MLKGGGKMVVVVVVVVVVEEEEEEEEEEEKGQEEQKEGEKMGADGVVCTGTGRARTRQLRNQKLLFEP